MRHRYLRNELRIGETSHGHRELYYYNIRGWKMTAFSLIEMITERDRILAKIILPDMTEREQIWVVASWLAYNIEFDHAAADLVMAGGPIRPSDFERYAFEHQMAWSALVLRRAVCAGMADAFIYFMRALDIEASYKLGHHNGMLHKWNLVYTDGEWLHVDIMLMQRLSQRAFLVTDDEMRVFGLVW